jgi:HK97 family phage portal protein
LPKRIPAIYKAAQRESAALRVSRRERPRVANGVHYAPLGAFRAKRSPTDSELVSSYRQATYVCAEINANALAGQPLNLFMTTKRGQRGARVPTKAISSWQMKSFQENPGLIRKMAGAEKVEQVVDHPLLDLLDTVNPWFNKFTLLKLTQLYLEITGKAFWTFVKGAVGKAPVEIWPLPAWLVVPQVDYVGTDVIARYLYTGGGAQTWYERDEVLYFRTMNLYDPYTQGWSPLRANYETAQINDKLVDYRDSVVTNRGRPDAVLEPIDKDTVMDPIEMQRVQGQFLQSFARAEAGGVWVAPGGFKLNPYSWSPTDMGEIEMERAALHNTARAHGIPIPLVDGSSENRANMDAALLQHARKAVLPRCRHMEEELNSNLVPLFDERLFLAFDNPVPADEVLERENNKAYIGMGVKSRNETRIELGLPPVEGGDELLVSNSLVPLSHAAKPPLPAIVRPAGGPNPDDLASVPANDRDEPEPEPGKDAEHTEETENDEPLEEGESIEGDKEPSKKNWGEIYLNPETGLPSIEAIEALGPEIEKYNNEHDPSTGRFGHGGGGTSQSGSAKKPTGGEKKPGHSGGGGGPGGGSGGGNSTTPSKKPASAPHVINGKPSGTKESVPEPPVSAKSERAKANYKKANKAEQDYGEGQEVHLAKSLGGKPLADNEATDVEVPKAGGKGLHGVEVKTLVSQKNDKITMKKEAIDRKVKWEKTPGNTMHTVVLDHRDKFNGGENASLHSGHEIYYRRGVGSFRVGQMYKVKDVAELKVLMDMPRNKLPKAAKGPVRR